MKLDARTSEKIALGFIWGVALAVIVVLIAIMGFILFNGLRHINWSFLTESIRRGGSQGGILPAIVGTVYITIFAVLFAVPFGIGTAFYLAEYTKGGFVTRAIRFATESLAGIPSIVYGLFGFIFFVEVLGFGVSVLSGSLTVAIMILPTIIRTSEEAILSVPKTYREVSYTLGATKWQTIRKAVTPSAIRGIANGIILSVGRCVAETAAVMLTAGGVTEMAKGLTDPTRTMAGHFYLLATSGDDRVMNNAYATAAILILLIAAINIIANVFVGKAAKGK